MSQAQEINDDSEVLEIDQAQLEHLLNVGGGEAEFIDQHGNRIRLTAEELINAGFTAETIDPNSSGHAYGTKTETEGYYLIESESQPSTSLNMPASIVVDQLPEVASETVVVTSTTIDPEADRPPILSASVPLRSEIQSSSGDPAMYQDAKQLTDLLEEYRKELREKDQRLKELTDSQRSAEKISREIGTALVKKVEWGEAEVYVGTVDAPESLTATVSVKRSRPHEAPPEDAIAVHLDSGETCYVIAEDLSGQLIQNQNGTDLESRAGLYSCDRCPRRFTVEFEMRRHQEVGHTPIFPFFCTYCDKNILVASESVLQAHIRIFHGKQKVPNKPKVTRATVVESEQEPQWELMTTDRSNESADADRVQGGEYKCNICSNNFPTAYSARKHVKVDHNIPDDQISQILFTLIKPTNGDTVGYACKVCQKTFSKKEYLKKHKLVHTDKIPFACKFCPRRFKWKENLQKHLSAHGSQANYKCPDCRLIFFNQTRLDVHYRSRHPGRLRDQVCPLCEKSYHEKDSLAKHMRGHSKAPVECTECTKKFTDLQFLSAHMAIHTGVKRFSCSICQRTFGRVENLSAHRQRHKAKKYKCPECNFLFATKRDMHRHALTHSKRWPWQCLRCNMRLLNENELQRHLQMHKSVKRYECAKCKRTFYNSDNLKLHVESHRQIRPYPCTKCDNAFYDQATLKRHMLLHTGKSKPYKCSLCGQMFDVKGELRAHLKSHMKYDQIPYMLISHKRGMASRVRFLCKEPTPALKTPVVNEQMENVIFEVPDECENIIVEPAPVDDVEMLDVAHEEHVDESYEAPMETRRRSARRLRP